MSSDTPRFYLQASDEARESFSRPGAVAFEWNILYACNYRCSYCFFEGKWEEYGARNRILGVEEWINRWSGVRESYGQCSLLITGGEPFIYPRFTELIERLSALHHPINISSNGSGDVESFIARVDPSKVSVSLSFHPQFNALEEVIATKKAMAHRGFHADFINLCCYPPFMEKLDGWIETAVRAGETLKVIPFSGTYEGKRYPDAYTDGEKAKLGIGRAWENNVRRKGKLCAAGMRSALLFPDGKVVRCGQIGEKHILGNFFDAGFRLLERPMACGVEYCPCLEADIVKDGQP